MPDLVTIGETCAVLVAATQGPLRYVRSFDMRPGGSESTVAAGVAKLGFTSGWISRLGNDELGQYILMVMRAENVDVSQVKLVDGRRTGLFVRESRTSGSPGVFYYRSGSAASEMTPDDLSEAYIAGAKILHLTGITPGLSPSCRETVTEAMKIAKKHSVVTTFDPNVRLNLWSASEARDVLEPMMAQADLLLAGREDVIKLIGPHTLEQTIQYLQELGCANFVLKTGKGGAVVCSGGDVVVVPTEPVSVVDRFGAGDAFAAGFIWARLQDLPMTTAASFGNLVAGYSIQSPGNIESLPDRQALDRLVVGDFSVRR